MAAKAITIGLNQNLNNAISRYFEVFRTLPPNDLEIDSVSQARGSASFETLLTSMIRAGGNQLLVIAHGYRNGSGLYLPLVHGRTGTTTKQNISRLLTMARLNRIQPQDLSRLTISRRQARRLIDLMRQVRNMHLNLLEFRGCNLGRDQQTMTNFANFFGARRMGAPDLHSFFGLSDSNVGAHILSTHAQHHRGRTYSYPYLNGNLIVCIGVNDANKPDNGHIVAATQQQIQSWVNSHIKRTTTQVGRQLPVHGLWAFPELNLDPTAIVDAPSNPRPIFPLPANDEYQQHVTYINGSTWTAAPADGEQGALHSHSSMQYASNQSGPVRGGVALFNGEVLGGIHQQSVLGFEDNQA